MVDVLALISQPLFIIVAAVALFTGLTILYARRLRSAARDPDLAKLLVSLGGPDALTIHKKSLENAKDETADNLTSAKEILHSHGREQKRSKQRKTKRGSSP